MTDDARATAPWPHRTEDPPAAPTLVNYEAEQGLLGALLTNNSVFDQVSDFLEPKHFGDPAHGRIYEAVASWLVQGRQANAFTLRPYFEADKDLTEAGGWQYLVRLTGATTTMVNADEYGRRIFDDWRRRNLRDLGAKLMAGALDLRLDRDVSDQVAEAEAALWELDRDGVSAALGPAHSTVGVDRYLELADQALKADGALIGITTGIGSLNDAMGGLHPGDLTVIAARPGMGKSALAGNIARAAAEDGGQVLFFSLEMSAEQLTGRMLAERTGVTTERVRKGQIDQREMGMLVAAAGWLKGLPLSIDASSNLTSAQIRSRARRHQRRHGLALVVVDYLQLMKGAGENRVQEVSGITRDLKSLAKDLGVPVVALSQLSRQVEMRDDKRPMLSDLKESGSIEQDADVVWFIFREEYYLSKEEPRQKPKDDDEGLAGRLSKWTSAMLKASGNAEIIIGKNRHGPERSVHLRFSGARQHFGDTDTPDQRQGAMLGGDEMPDERG